MAYVSPPPVFVVRPHRPRHRHTLLIVLAWLLSLLVAFFAGPVLQHRLGGLVDHAPLIKAQKEHDALLQQVATAERAAQVARAANVDLQQNMTDRQEEIAGLRADLAFYSRLTDGASKLETLNVHGVHLTPGASARVYNFSVTLTQTLRSGQVASGRTRLSVSGVQDGKLVTLAWPQVAPNQNAAGLEFSFKYFQQVAGTLMLPDGFTPNSIHVEADAGGDMGRASQDFSWTDALAAQQEIPDVQHQP